MSQNLVTVASSTPELSSLVSAVKIAGLVTTLSNLQGYTLFAPINQAFQNIEVPMNTSQLKTILLNHVFSGIYTTQQLSTMSGQTITALSGSKYMIIVKNGNIFLRKSYDINGQRMCMAAMVIKSNIIAGNNIVHEIDQVLL